jgi:predicted O-linked N-acetylglucosamine transferase (SPINDLY family)
MKVCQQNCVSFLFLCNDVVPSSFSEPAADCNGQTGRESLPALAMRPAALHVHYLGFPSTIGASYIDHIIGLPSSTNITPCALINPENIEHHKGLRNPIQNHTPLLSSHRMHCIAGDPIVSPPELVGYYTEKLLILPNTFQVTSHKTRQPHPFPDGRASPLPPMRHAGVGYIEGEEDLRVYHNFPPTGPLLCNWNQHFKLDPEFFGVWTRIIKRVPNSTLVMLRYPEVPV